MRLIRKGSEPPTLQRYRAVPGATYDGKDFTPVKDEIRKALRRDQHSLCCYCMRSIAAKDQNDALRMKVEHWQSQVRRPDLQLAWMNMLGSCLGGEGSPRRDQTCDTRKGDAEITLNPLNQGHILTLRCRSNGRLESTNPAFQQDIDERLGLNHEILRREREEMLARELAWLGRRYRTSTFPPGAVRARVDELETPSEGPGSSEWRLSTYCSVLRLWARKRYGAGF